MIMKCVKDIKEYCLKEMTRHSEHVAGAKAADTSTIEASHKGSIEALHDLYTKLVIYFPEEPMDDK